MKRKFITTIAALLFIMVALVSCSQPTIVDSTPQNETTTSSSTIVDKDPIVKSWYGDGDIRLLKYKSNPSPYDESPFDINESYFIKPYKESQAIKPGKYLIQSMSDGDNGRYYANGDFYFDNVVLKVNKKYWIYRDHIEEKNQ